MARVTAERVKESKRQLLDAAQKVLLEEGYAGLSTRRVAEAANTQMSQIQYHFGSKEGMILALFEHLNAQLIDRQTQTFDNPDLKVSEKWDLACDAQLIDRQTQTFDNPDLKVSEKWDLACDYLDDDIASGYVRVLMELTAAGWSKPVIAEAVRAAYAQWRDLILQLVRQIEEETGTLGPFTAEDIGALVSAGFIGAEAAIMLDYESSKIPFRDALRRFGKVIEFYERSG